MKRTSLFFLLFIVVLNAKAQDDKTVTLTVTGEGKTKQEARTNALRSAIEQAYGTFISSKTKVVNDSLIKDEIVSVTNGNIQKFEVVSEMQLPNGNFANITKATVSVSKLTTFCESKGLKVEFKGSLFAENIRVQELNEKNEEKAINNLVTILTEIQKKCFDYKISVKEPVQNGNLWKVNVEAKVAPNDNLKIFQSTLITTLTALAMTNDEISNYKELGKEYFPMLIAPIGLKSDSLLYLCFRNESTFFSLIMNIYNFSLPVSSFTISNGITNTNFLRGTTQNNKDNTFYKSININSNFSPVYFEASFLDGYKIIHHLNYSTFDYYFQSYFKFNFNDNSDDAYFFKYVKNRKGHFSYNLSSLKSIDFIKQYDKNYKLSISKTDYKIVNEGRGGYYPPVFKTANNENLKISLILNFQNAFQKEILFNYEENFTLDEIKKITEYKIIPNSN